MREATKNMIKITLVSLISGAVLLLAAVLA